MLEVCPKNRIEFRYVLNEVWYASSENMSYIKRELEKEFIMPLKSNRKVALSLSKKRSEERVRATRVSRIGGGHGTGSLRGASGVRVAFGQASLQERGR